MGSAVGDLLHKQWQRGVDRTVRGARAIRHRGLGQMQFWLIALLIGIAAGGAAVVFRLAIEWLQETVYGENDRALATHAMELHWGWIITIPVVGGLIVGFLLQAFTPDGRARSVAHVIEGAALREGRVDRKAGIASALASLVTLSTGGSTGREGPVVHIGAMISSWVSDVIHADGITARDLMGCAAAAAVSASFNAPIAGAIFALEVVLRHFAVHAFAPIVIASVSGAVISRLTVGDVTEYVLPVHNLAFYVELPAFMLLGLVCGLVAAAMMWAIFAAEDLGDAVQGTLRIPNWARPALAGLILGIIAIFFPHIIGVGYETVSNALTEGLTLRDAVVFAAIKVVAVAVTMAGRMGGGVFSPSLMLGALTGLAFGIIATSIFPAVSGTAGLYAIAGMGAVAAAVLGAPISTALIVFEMTGDWQAGLAVMVAVSLSTALSVKLVKRSFFLTQIERRGLHLAAGPQEYLMATLSAGRLMRTRKTLDASEVEFAMTQLGDGICLHPYDTLETALPLFDRTGAMSVPVVVEGALEGDPEELLGVLHHIDALKAYNRALAETAREEHS